MHQTICVRVRAEDANEAINLVQDALEDTCGEGKDWDYLDGSLEVVTHQMLRKMKLKNWPALQAYYKDMTRQSIKHSLESIKESLVLPLAKIFMRRKDALLYLDSEDEKLQAFVKSLLESGKDSPNALSFGQILQAVSGMLEDLAETDSLFGYRLNKISDCTSALNDPEDYNARNARDSYYAELPDDGRPSHPEKLKVFYVLGSRHF